MGGGSIPTRLTPQDVALCTLLRALGSPQKDCISTSQIFRKLLVLTRDSNVLSTWSFGQLLSQLQGSMVGVSESSTAWAPDVIREQLQAFRSSDDLLSFFSELKDLVHRNTDGRDVEGGYHQSSALGQYLHRCCLDYEDLTLEGLCRLLSDVKAFLESPDAPPSMPSQRPAALQEHVKALEQQDVILAINRSHEHFDHKGVEAKKGSSGKHQSALLNLGAVHTHFGHVQEATLALTEAMHIAQQSGDNMALAHSLAMLSHLVDSASLSAAPVLSSGPPSRRAEAKHIHLLRLLRKCLGRAQKLQLPHVEAYARLVLAKFALQHTIPIAGQASPEERQQEEGHPSGAAAVSKAWQDLAHSHLAASLAAAVPVPPMLAPAPAAGVNPPRHTLADLYTQTDRPVFDPAFQESHTAAAAAVQQSTAAALLLKGLPWKRAAAPSLAAVSALTHLVCHGDAPPEERCLAFAQLAQHAAEHRGCRAAEQVLQVADAECPGSQSTPLMLARLGIAHSRALARRDISDAQRFGSMMSALCHPDDAVMLEHRVEAEIRNAHTLLRAGNYEEALQAASQLFELCVEADFQEEAVGILLLMADIYSEADHPCSALPYALSAWLHATELGMDLKAAEATSKLAAANAKMGYAATATSSFNQQLPCILAAAPLRLKARALNAMADAALAGASEEDIQEDPHRYLAPLRIAAAALEDSEDWAEAADAHHLAALICDTAHLQPQRNLAASSWQRVAARACSVSS